MDSCKDQTIFVVLEVPCDSDTSNKADISKPL